MTRTLLFDGETALRSKKVQNEIFKKCNLKIHAEPYYKRNMAERAIKEIKLRMALLLDMEKKPLTKWKEYLDTVVNSINNHNKKNFRSLQNQLFTYFTQTHPVIPQTHSSFYKFNINDVVGLNVFAKQRKEMGFKYSLNRGKCMKVSIRNFFLNMKKINVSGKLQNNLKAVVKKRKLIVKNDRIIPIYIIEEPNTGKVRTKYIHKVNLSNSITLKKMYFQT
jgi:hypothetical protein